MHKKILVSVLAITMLSITATVPVFADNNEGTASVSADAYMHDELNNRRDNAQRAIEAKRNNWGTMMRTKQMEKKADWKSTIEGRWKFIGNGFENIMMRLDSRIAKLTAEGKNTSEAQAYVEAARTAFATATAQAQTLAQQSREKQLTREEKQAAKASIEALLQTAKESLRLATQSLIELR